MDVREFVDKTSSMLIRFEMNFSTNSFLSMSFEMSRISITASLLFLFVPFVHDVFGLF